MVVHGADGLDELSTIGRTAIAWLRGGEVSLLETTPRDFGVRTARPEEIMGTTPEESAEVTFKLLTGHPRPNDPKRDIVLVNASAGIVAGGEADDFKHGMELAGESMESGAAYRKLKALIKASGRDISKLEELERKYA